MQEVSFRKKILLFILVISGVLFSIALFIVVLEMFILKPLPNISPIIAVHKANLESLNALNINTNNAIPIVKELAGFYFKLSSIFWMSWFVPINGLLFTAWLFFSVSHRGIYKKLEQKTIYYRDHYKQEQRRRIKAEQKKDDYHNHLISVHDQMEEGFIQVRSDERIEHINAQGRKLVETWAKLQGKAYKNFTGAEIQDIFPGYLTSGLHLLFQEVASQHQTKAKEIFLEPVGVWLHVRLHPEDKEIYIYFRDITEMKKPENTFRSSDILLRQLSASAPLSIAVVDRQWHYLLTSNQWKKDFELGDEDITGKNHKELLPSFPGKWAELEALLDKGQAVSSDETMFKLNGQEEWIAWEVRPWQGAHGRVNGYIIYAQLVTQQHLDKSKMKQQRAREKQLAYHDILTGLPNRQLFYDRLNMELAHAYRQLGKVALIFLDLDGFKAVNDNLGHDVGDILLKQVAQRLSTCVRETDTVARLGGDEFTLILSGITTKNDVIGVAQKIINIIAEPFIISGQNISVTTSIGISMYPSDGSSTAELIKKADTAMYKSKDSGKNTYNFFEDMKAIEGQTLNTDKEMGAQLENALSAGEMEVFFQPQYSLTKRRIFGLEALLRWNHPKLGILTPEKFLDLAETNGQIIPIGEWVAYIAAERGANWLKQSEVELRIAVNLSLRQLQDEELPIKINTILEKTGLKPSLLAIEISEDVLVENDSTIRERLKQISQKGVKIFIDDFGTSYTPINDLKHYPLDGLKIHQSFIHRAIQNTEDRAIVKAVITLANDLGLELIAEGVETEEQAEFLLANGCDNAQGYLFGKPVQPIEVPEFFVTKSSDGFV